MCFRELLTAYWMHEYDYANEYGRQIQKLQLFELNVPRLYTVTWLNIGFFSLMFSAGPV